MGPEGLYQDAERRDRTHQQRDAMISKVIIKRGQSGSEINNQRSLDGYVRRFDNELISLLESENLIVEENGVTTIPVNVVPTIFRKLGFHNLTPELVSNLIVHVLDIHAREVFKVDDLFDFLHVVLLGEKLLQKNASKKKSSNPVIAKVQGKLKLASTVPKVNDNDKSRSTTTNDKGRKGGFGTGETPEEAAIVQAKIEVYLAKQFRERWIHATRTTPSRRFRAVDDSDPQSQQSQHHSAQKTRSVSQTSRNAQNSPTSPSSSLARRQPEFSNNKREWIREGAGAAHWEGAGAAHQQYDEEKPPSARSPSQAGGLGGITEDEGGTRPSNISYEAGDEVTEKPPHPPTTRTVL